MSDSNVEMYHPGTDPRGSAPILVRPNGVDRMIKLGWAKLAGLEPVTETANSEETDNG